VLVDHFLALLYRARFYMDLPGMLQLLKFQDLRAGYYRELWQRAAVTSGLSAPGGGAAKLALTPCLYPRETA
jgi:hypothetical protein